LEVHCDAKMRNDSGGFDMKNLQDQGAMRGACSRSLENSCSMSFGNSVGRTFEVNAVEAGGTHRRASMKFHVANVQRPLVSAVKVVQAGNRVVMDSSGSFIENARTGELLPLRVERGTFFFDVEYHDGSAGTISRVTCFPPCPRSRRSQDSG
jgi:hypothetical protein